MFNYENEQAFSEMHYQDHLRETASRDHHRTQELSSVKASVEGSVESVAVSVRSLICLVGPLQRTSVCPVPA
ncbi:MAG: hypothetical protein ACYCYF_11020 [Anaerolineae bacterium]